MWAGGTAGRPMAVAGSFLQMAMSMKANGLMIEHMVMEFIGTLMEVLMKGIGKMISKKEGVKRLGQTNLFTLESLWEERSIAEVNLLGLMELAMTGSGDLLEWTDMVFSPGLTNDNTRDIT